MKAWDVAAYDWIVLADSNVLISPDDPTGCSPVGASTARWSARHPSASTCTDGRPSSRRRSSIPSRRAGSPPATRSASASPRARRCSCGGAISPPRAGWVALAREVAEDAAATKFARRLGRKVRVVDRPFAQPLVRLTFAGVWLRQLRWARLRRLSFPAFFCAELPVGGVFPCLLAGWLAIAGVLPWAGVVAMNVARHGCRGGVGARLRLAAAPPLADALGRARPPAAGPLGPRLEAQGLRMARQRGRRQPDGASPICPIRHAPAPLAAALRLAPVDMRRAATRATCL